MQVRIETGRKLKKLKVGGRGAKAHENYPFASMKVGNSFQVFQAIQAAGEAEKATDEKSAIKLIRNRITSYRHSTTLWARFDVGHDEETGELICQRVEDRAPEPRPAARKEQEAA